MWQIYQTDNPNRNKTEDKEINKLRSHGYIVMWNPDARPVGRIKGLIETEFTHICRPFTVRGLRNGETQVFYHYNQAVYSTGRERLQQLGFKDTYHITRDDAKIVARLRNKGYLVITPKIDAMYHSYSRVFGT